ncbi:MAG: D-alanyl-D-alanine carboxypeptidase family protein [Eubacteriaceae bacterium]
MKKKTSLIFVLLLLLGTGTVFGNELPTYLPSEGVMVEEVGSNAVVFKQNENQKYFPASITKLLTALVAVENGDLNQKMIVGPEIEMIDTDSSVANLEIGEELTLKDLLYGLLLPSGNDAGNVIAVNIGKKILGNNESENEVAILAFVEAMNKKAQSIGMASSNFTNAHGLHNENHYSTPNDLLRLGEAAFKEGTIKEITKSKSYQVTTNLKEHLWNNSNMMLYPTYGEMPLSMQEGHGGQEANPTYNSYATSGKTGFTDEGGRCLIFEGEGKGKNVIGVILNADKTDIFTESSQTITAVIDAYDFINWTGEKDHYSDVAIANAHILDDPVLEVSTKKPVKTLAPVSKVNEYFEKVTWKNELVEKTDEGTFISKDIVAGTEVGELEIYYGDTLIEKEPLYATNDMQVKKWYDIFIKYWMVTLGGLMVMVAGVVAMIVLVNKKKKKSKAKDPRINETKTPPQKTKNKNKKVNKKINEVVNQEPKNETITEQGTINKEAKSDFKIETPTLEKAKKGNDMLEDAWMKIVDEENQYQDILGTESLENPDQQGKKEEIIAEAPINRDKEIEKEGEKEEDPLAEIRALLSSGKEEK